jgi:hypothetical protein
MSAAEGSGQPPRKMRAAFGEFGGIVHATSRLIQKKFRRAVNFPVTPHKKKRLQAQPSRARSPSEGKENVLKLPAVAAIATVTAISAAPTAAASTAIPAPTTASSTAVAAASTASSTAALRLWTSFVDYQVPAAKILTVEIGNGAIRFFIVCDFDERESPRLPRESIPN